MKLFDLFEGNEQAYNWHSEPEQRSMDATRAARLYREREPEGSEAIDARLRAQNDQLAQYAQSGNFWLKQKDTQEHISDVFVGKAAANAAAVELLKQRPELRGNLVITAYGPGEQQGVAEDMSRRGFLRGLGAAALGAAGVGAASQAQGKVTFDNGKQINPPDWKNFQGTAPAQGAKPQSATATNAAPMTGAGSKPVRTADALQALSDTSKETAAAAHEAWRNSQKLKSNPKFREEYDRIEKFYDTTRTGVLTRNKNFSADPDLRRRQIGEMFKMLIDLDREFVEKTNALINQYGRLKEQGVAEAPGAETLGHNQSTVSSNLNSLDLGEGDISQLEKDIADAPVAPIANMEGEEKIGGRYDADDFDDMVARLKKLAGAGPMQTKYDPARRVYRNVPTAQQPPQQPKK